MGQSKNTSLNQLCNPHCICATCSLLKPKHMLLVGSNLRTTMQTHHCSQSMLKAGQSDKEMPIIEFSNDDACTCDGCYSHLQSTGVTFCPSWVIVLLVVVACPCEKCRVALMIDVLPRKNEPATSETRVVSRIGSRGPLKFSTTPQPNHHTKHNNNIHNNETGTIHSRSRARFSH